MNTMTPSTHPGLLGICLSGAGPTILALVHKSPSSSTTGTITTDSSEITLGETEGKNSQMAEIGEAIKSIWAKEGIDVKWMELEVDFEGATCVEL